jgi:hypothetical protein
MIVNIVLFIIVMTFLIYISKKITAHLLTHTNQFKQLAFLEKTTGLRSIDLTHLFNICQLYSPHERLMIETSEKIMMDSGRKNTQRFSIPILISHFIIKDKNVIRINTFKLYDFCKQIIELIAPTCNGHIKYVVDHIKLFMKHSGMNVDGKITNNDVLNDETIMHNDLINGDIIIGYDKEDHKLKFYIDNGINKIDCIELTYQQDTQYITPKSNKSLENYDTNNMDIKHKIYKTIPLSSLKNILSREDTKLLSEYGYRKKWCSHVYKVDDKHDESIYHIVLTTTNPSVISFKKNKIIKTITTYRHQ